MIIARKDNMPLATPAKKPLAVPTQALADAIAEEWKARKAFNAAAMPLTSLAYTAIDRIEEERDNIVEVLLAYVDTDTLCYRASGSKTLQERQKKEWDPILAWAGGRCSALWQTTTGVMPLTQPEPLHHALRAYLEGLSSMRLAACLLLTSLYSSLALAMAVMENRLPAETAFALSRLEETFQAEEWGEDESASQRQENILNEIKGIARFLRLLGSP